MVENEPQDPEGALARARAAARLREEGDLEGARRELETAVAAWERFSAGVFSDTVLPSLYEQLAGVREAQGAEGDAEAWLLRAVEASRRGSPYHFAHAVVTLAELRLRAGRAAAAAPLLPAALPYLEASAPRPGIPFASRSGADLLGRLAALCDTFGDSASAKRARDLRGRMEEALARPSPAATPGSGSAALLWGLGAIAIIVAVAWVSC